jgi:2-dehydropantoate 2-reductase
MKIAIVGAGALGCTYAAHLARLGPEVDVVLVVRALERAPKRVVAERVSPAGAALVWDAPAAATSVPDDADVVLLTVRVDQLEGAHLHAIATRGPADRIVVALTPMLPEIRARVAEALGSTLVDAMPGVVAYAPEAGHAAPESGQLHLRFWTPKSSPTALEERPDDAARGAKVRALCDALVRAGVPAHVARKVHATNQATTIAMFPLLLGIAAAGGSIDALLGDGAVLKLALAATKETRAVAKTVGELAGFASILLSFAGPFTIRAGMKIVRSRAPEALTFLEKHFGGKLRGQNHVMYEAIVRLAEAHRLEVTSLRALAGRAGIS